MKLVLVVTFLTLFGFAADKPMVGPRYRHIMDSDGKLLATIDGKDGSIDYKEDPKKVVEFLVKAIEQIAQAQQQAQAAAIAPKTPEKKSEKKK